MLLVTGARKSEVLKAKWEDFDFQRKQWTVEFNKTGKLRYIHIFTSWDRVRKQAGLPDVRIHDLRHSFASFLINNGRSLYEVQKILGHTQVKTTQRYAHLSDDSLNIAANTVSSALNLGSEAMPQQLKDITLIEAQ